MAAHRRGRRAALARLVRRSGATALLRRLPTWRGVLILNYHRIGDPSGSELHPQLWSATADGLDRQLRQAQRSFDVIAPAELAASLRARAGRRILVTFDDGYRDLHAEAAPVLRAHGVSAGIFLCSGFIDGTTAAWWDDIAWMIHRSRRADLPPGPWSARPLALAGAGRRAAIVTATQAYAELGPPAAAAFLTALAAASGSGRRAPAADWISWETARALKAEGHAIGAHTVSHPVLSRLPRERQLAEITGSMDRIEAELGERPRWFAYPVGSRAAFTATTQACARDAGVELAFSNYDGHASPARPSPLDVRRVSIGSLHTADFFAATLLLPQLLAAAR